ncbi:hypothetical protein C8R46DRAFT_1040895 [Mycena filopes]|nr:hypothetical protein C8R46DRAFT_1040895 [Mycena filopes]
MKRLGSVRTTPLGVAELDLNRGKVSRLNVPQSTLGLTSTTNRGRKRGPAKLATDLYARSPPEVSLRRALLNWPQAAACSNLVCASRGIVANQRAGSAVMEPWSIWPPRGRYALQNLARASRDIMANAIKGEEWGCSDRALVNLATLRPCEHPGTLWPKGNERAQSGTCHTLAVLSIDHDVPHTSDVLHTVVATFICTAGGGSSIKRRSTEVNISPPQYTLKMDEQPQRAKRPYHRTKPTVLKCGECRRHRVQEECIQGNDGKCGSCREKGRICVMEQGDPGPLAEPEEFADDGGRGASADDSGGPRVRGYHSWGPQSKIIPRGRMHVMVTDQAQPPKRGKSPRRSRSRGGSFSSRSRPSAAEQPLASGSTSVHGQGPPRSTGPPVASTSSHRGSHINPGYMGRGAMSPAPMQGQAFSGPPGHGNAPPYAPGGHGQYAPQAPPGGHQFHGSGPGAPPQGPQYAPGGHGQYGSQPPPGGHQFHGGGPGAPQYAPGYGAPGYTAYGGHGPPPTMHPPHQDWSGERDPRNDADGILRIARQRHNDSQDPK